MSGTSTTKRTMSESQLPRGEPDEILTVIMSQLGQPASESCARLQVQSFLYVTAASSRAQPTTDAGIAQTQILSTNRKRRSIALSKRKATTRLARCSLPLDRESIASAFKQQKLMEDSSLQSL